jgi:hypothetical protein
MNEVEIRLCTLDWSAVANWLTALSSVAVAIAAMMGLTAWKKQLRATTRYEAARTILGLIHQIQGRLWLEPVAHFGGKPVPPQEIISKMPDLFVDMVKRMASANLGVVEPLIASLRSEALAAKAILGRELTGKLTLLASSMNALKPNYRSVYLPTAKETGGEQLTPEQFTERTVRNSILKAPKRIDEIEQDLGKLG